MATSVINIYADLFRPSGEGFYPVHRGTFWGNPFALKSSRWFETILVGSRAEAIRRYCPWIRWKLRRHPEKAVELLEQRNRRLGCFCKPAACHGDILAAVIENAWKEIDACGLGPPTPYRGTGPWIDLVCFYLDAQCKEVK